MINIVKGYMLEFTLAAIVVAVTMIGVFIAVGGSKGLSDDNDKEVSYNFLDERAVIYGYDKRTELCFARLEYNSRTLVTVECTEKVLSVINGRDSDGIVE